MNPPSHSLDLGRRTSQSSAGSPVVPGESRAIAMLTYLAPDPDS